MDFARFVKETREKLDMTQEQLADQLDRSKLWISQVECGRSDPGPVFLVRLCQLAKLDPRPVLLAHHAKKLPGAMGKYLAPEMLKDADASTLPQSTRDFLDANPEQAKRLGDDGLRFLQYLCGMAGPPAPDQAVPIVIEYQEAMDCLDTIFSALIGPGQEDKRRSVLGMLKLLRDSVASPAGHGGDKG